MREHSALVKLRGLARNSLELGIFGGSFNSLFGRTILPTPRLGDLGIVPYAEVVVTDEEGDSLQWLFFKRGEDFPVKLGVSFWLMH